MNEECEKKGHNKQTMRIETLPNGAKIRHWICTRCFECDYEPALCARGGTVYALF